MNRLKIGIDQHQQKEHLGSMFKYFTTPACKPDG